MSDESATSTEQSATSTAKSTKRARRVSTPRSKKAAMPGEENPVTVVEAPVSEESKAATDVSESGGVQEAPSAEVNQDESEAVAPAVQEGAKRKRRRKKGKGSGSQPAAPQQEGESEALVTASVQQSRPIQSQRPKPDAATLAKYAWKIYLAEISEEGVALVGDNDARELSRRCFRLAEIFMEEETPRR